MPASILFTLDCVFCKLTVFYQGMILTNYNNGSKNLFVHFFRIDICDSYSLRPLSRPGREDQFIFYLSSHYIMSCSIKYGLFHLHLYLQVTSYVLRLHAMSTRSVGSVENEEEGEVDMDTVPVREMPNVSFGDWRLKNDRGNSTPQTSMVSAHF